MKTNENYNVRPPMPHHPNHSMNEEQYNNNYNNGNTNFTNPVNVLTPDMAIMPQNRYYYKQNR
jgi:hypothetical protein